MGQNSIPAGTFPQTFSHSSISCYRECPRKYWFSYEALGTGIAPATSSVALQIGTLYHSGMELLLKNGLQAAEEMVEQYEAKFDFGADPEVRASIAAHSKGLLIAHDRKLKTMPTDSWTLIEAEKQFSLEIEPGVFFVGKLDALIQWDGAIWLMEHKALTIVDDSLFSTLPSDGQILRYTYAQRSEGVAIVGVVYTVAKKCQLRLKKTETPIQLNERMIEWYRTEAEVQHEIVRFGKGDVQRCWNGTLSTIKTMIADTDYVRHENACRSKFGMCPFYGICMKQEWTEADLVPAGFRPKTSRHEELED